MLKLLALAAMAVAVNGSGVPITTVKKLEVTKQGTVKTAAPVDKPAETPGKSPIDLQRPTINTRLPALNPVYCAKEGLPLVNTGNGVAIHFPMGLSAEDKPILTGGPLSAELGLRDVFFKWGKTDGVGSEHTINGDHYALEMQMFHYDETKFGDAHQAAKTGGAGAVVALSVLFKVGEENCDLIPVTDRLELVKSSKSKSQVVSELDLGRVLPENKDYFSYQGSLTDGAQEEGVNWLVFTHPATISQAQMDQFRLLSADWATASNGAPIQAKGNRQLVASGPVPLKFSDETHMTPQFYDQVEEEAPAAEGEEEGTVAMVKNLPTRKNSFLQRKVHKRAPLKPAFIQPLK